MFTNFRKKCLTAPIYKWGQKVMPALSATESEALEAGDIWWDAELFSGNPDWEQFDNLEPANLSEKEQDFLSGPVEDLCAMLDEWQINNELCDLPQEVWDFLREKRFFAMIIPEKFGGLEFSAYANSEIIRKIASRSLVTSVTVMVPNSLGPGELLMKFGTTEQQDYWLPRLAQGKDIPCFGLTSEEAGSDAASMIDRGVVCEGEYKGKKVTGIRLNWHKRYITLGPVATVLGLAFKLYDPDHILSEQEERGITVALVPTDLEGIDIGRRHIPSGQMFQNGPNWGKDVFIPLDHVIGGEEKIGQGWKMLMSALAAGRGISLPSLSAAGAAFAARTTGAYALVRRQFGIPIGKFEGIQLCLGRMAANAYLIDAARRLTCIGLDIGHDPAIVSAIMKAHATQRMRESVIDAMDIHGGKAIIQGPSNYIGSLYDALPVGITVEGANILTRNLIIFGQGSIRCHPWLLKEMQALGNADKKQGLEEFDKAFWGHVGHSIKTLGRAWLRSWSGGKIAPAPENAHDKLLPYYKNLSRYCAAFALLSDGAFLTLGGSLKRKEMLSARLGDILSELYLLCGVLKRWEDEGQNEQDFPLVQYCMEDGLTRIENTMAAILKNLPARPVAWLMRFIVQPLGAKNYGPSDKLIQNCAVLLMEQSATRDRLTSGLHAGMEGDAIHTLERAFDLVHETQPLRGKMEKAGIKTLEDAIHKGVLNETDAEKIRQADEAVQKTIAVDHYAPEQFSGRIKKKKDHS